MNLRFRYDLVRLGRMIPSLGGRTVRPRPLVDVSVLSRSATIVRRAILDTAADDTVFPAVWAIRLGLDLTNAPSGSATVASTGTVALRYADVTLRLSDGREWCAWPAVVGFTSAPLVHPMLGFAGCLQFFHAFFYGDIEEVELTANRLYRGQTGRFGSPEP